MQFSLKWILVAVVYVAIAAAAFSQQSWVYADILWALSLLATVFAALFAFMGRDKGRVAAAGFLLAGLAYIACVAFGEIGGGDVVPTKRWLAAAGYSPSFPFFPNFANAATATPVYSPVATGTLTLQSAPAATVYAQSTSTLPSKPMPAPAPLTAPTPPADFGIFVRAANAVSMMLFGALGALVGLFAFKRTSQTTPTPRG
jgi:hypothetical protein